MINYRERMTVQEGFNGKESTQKGFTAIAL